MGVGSALGAALQTFRFECLLYINVFDLGADEQKKRDQKEEMLCNTKVQFVATLLALDVHPVH